MCILFTHINNINQVMQIIEITLEFLLISCFILNVKYE